MKTFKQILVVVMMALIAISPNEAFARTRAKSKRQTKAKSSVVATPTTYDIIKGIEMMANEMSTTCPKEMYDGLATLESVSFKNKCLSMTFAYSDKFEELMDGAIISDYSYIDYNMKLTIVKMIKTLNVSASFFGKTGISFCITFKDNYGNIIWSGNIAPNEYVAFYNELEKTGEMPSSKNLYNLEAFKQMVNSWNACAPQDLGDGITFTGASMNGTNIYYDNTVPYSYVLIFQLIDDEDLEEVKKDAAKYLYDLLTKFSSNSRNSILDNMIRLGITINYRYYVVNDDTPIQTINIPASYIKRIGTKRQ